MNMNNGPSILEAVRYLFLAWKHTIALYIFFIAMAAVLLFLNVHWFLIVFIVVLCAAGLAYLLELMDRIKAASASADFEKPLLLAKAFEKEKVPHFAVKIALSILGAEIMVKNIMEVLKGKNG